MSPKNKIKNNKIDFNNFLYGLFDIKNKETKYNKSPIAKKKVTAKKLSKVGPSYSNSLELIINKHLDNEVLSKKQSPIDNCKDDLDETLIINWKEKVKYFKLDLLLNNRKILKKKKEFFDKTAEILLNNPLHLWSPFCLLREKIALVEKENLEFEDEEKWPKRLFAVACIVVILTIAIGSLNPALIKKLAGISDGVIVEPIASLFQDTNKNTAFVVEKKLQNNPPITREMLANYIINLNQSEEAINFTSKNIVKVRVEDLYVRVAGVSEQFSEDGEVLTNDNNLSKNIKEAIKMTKNSLSNSLKNLSLLQETISKDLNKKFKELLTK